VTGDTAWLQKKDWKHFCEYEEGLNEAVANQRLAVLCTYPLAACGAMEILDVVRTHQFAVAKRHGDWDVIETAGLKLAKEEIKRLNDELEQRVLERTSQLMLASGALREAQAELAHVNRVTTMGQLAASIAHELNQPLAASVTNACAGLRWLGLQPPNLEEVREALAAIVTDSNRAGHVINRMRALIKKNAVEAMGSVNHGSRELLIGTGANESGGVRISVQDSGPGLNSQVFDRLFDPFYTTKADGMGMGLSICRSIIEAHDGRIWASAMPGPGSTFNVSLPGAVDKGNALIGAPVAERLWSIPAADRSALID
jgi:C4-dicarboxylate-specific signal transduction histidine kinase